MYAALWRVLPGPLWVKILQIAILATGVIGALMGWVFPWVAAEFLVEQSTIG